MIRFGIAGFGLHAVKRLMPGFAMAQNCQVTALSRRSLEQARASAKQYQIPHAFDSVEALSRCSEVDAVFIATPNACHLADVLAALHCGKPVLCEKPMGVKAEECRQMVEAARSKRLLLGVAQVFRFEDSLRRVRELLAMGMIGRPIHARSEFCFDARQHARTWIADRAIAGGGPMADIGVHCIDALRFVLEDEVTRVNARTTFDQASRDVEASAALTLEFARGTLGSVFVSTRADYRTPLEIVGEQGVLRAANALNVEHPITLEIQRGSEVTRETVSNRLAYAEQVDAFAAALERGVRFPAPGEEGWQNQEILDAAYRSAAAEHFEIVSRVRSRGSHSLSGLHH
jgi:predicted dehydrogenase